MTAKMWSISFASTKGSRHDDCFMFQSYPTDAEIRHTIELLFCSFGTEVQQCSTEHEAYDSDLPFAYNGNWYKSDMYVSNIREVDSSIQALL